MTTNPETAGVEPEGRAISDHPCHGLFTTAGDRLTHRHWFQGGDLMPTCERCGTLIDRHHKEVGPVSWEPEKRKEIITSQDRYELSQAAMSALGEWLVWPDAGRDGPREVTVEQTLSFLRGLPNKLGYTHPAPASNTTSEGEVWRHKKRGTNYEKIGVAELQCATGQNPGEGEGLVIYRGEDGKLWARLADEFHDGRFEWVPLAAIRSGSV